MFSNVNINTLYKLSLKICLIGKCTYIFKENKNVEPKIYESKALIAFIGENEFQKNILSLNLTPNQIENKKFEVDSWILDLKIIEKILLKEEVKIEGMEISVKKRFNSIKEITIINYYSDNWIYIFELNKKDIKTIEEILKNYNELLSISPQSK